MLKKQIGIFICLVCLAAFGFALVGCTSEADVNENAQETQEETWEEESDSEEEEENGDEGLSFGDINLRDIYGGGSNYLFTYKGEDYTAIYYYDNWCIYDSYKITNGFAMKKICQALIDEHPIHGSDYESYRTAKDMVYEWKQHNIAYAVLPDDNPWKTTTGNVDFDPEDQGKSLEELYEDRTGEEFDFAEHTEDVKEYLKRFLE